MSAPKPIRQLIGAIVLVAVTGCGGGDAIVGPSDSSRGMIVGHFDYSDSKYRVSAVTMDPADRNSIRMGMRGERVHLYTNGTFFADDLKPGKYMISALLAGNVVLTPPNEPKMEVTVGPGEIRYIGTYKLNIESPGLLSRKGGSIARTDKNPNERQLLERVRELVKDTDWRVKVEKRIAQLKRNEPRAGLSGQ